jgi:hypothetical protein
MKLDSKFLKNQHLKIILGHLVVTFSLFWITFNCAALVICRESGVSGMHASQENAYKAIGEQITHTQSEAKVYIEYVDGDLYYQSNYISSGKDDAGKPLKYPTKVAGTFDINVAVEKAVAKAKSEGTSQAEAAENARKQTPMLRRVDVVFPAIVHWGEATEAQRAETLATMREKVQFVLDASVFDEKGIPRVDLSGVKNVQVVSLRGNLSQRWSAEVLPTSSPPPSIISKIKGCCLYGRPPHLLGRLSEALSQRKFDAKKVKVASLFIDSGTNRAIDRSALVKSARVNSDSSSLKSEADMRKIFQESKGNTLVLLGHVEGADYVVRTNKNIVQLRLPISTVRAMAKENGVSLIDIGCETTKAIKSQSFGFGVMTEYISVDAINSLETALHTSNTLGDFLENMSSEGLKIVVEPSFLAEQEKSVSVYSKIRSASKATWLKIAQITFTYFK